MEIHNTDKEKLKLIKEFREELKIYNPSKLLSDSKEAYAKWQTQTIDNSDLAKEIRAFQDIFKGCLNNAWQKAGNLKSSELKAAFAILIYFKSMFI